MRSLIIRSGAALTCTILVLAAIVGKERLVEGATSINIGAGALITVADNVASNGQLLTFPAVNVSKYSEVSILASAPGASTSNSGGVGFWFLAAPFTLSEDLPTGRSLVLERVGASSTSMSHSIARWKSTAATIPVLPPRQSSHL